MIDVSICCATYNQKKYILKTVESFLMQKHENFSIEIIIHDDCSTDGTVDILKELELKYKEIHLILQKENQFCKGRKIIPILVEKARGKYIAFCEGDDFWIDSLKIKKQYEYMENNPDCSLCCSNAILVDEKGNKIGDYNHVGKDIDVGLKECVLNDGNYIPTATLFFRKSDVLNLPECYFNSPVGDYPLQIYLSGLSKCHYFVNQTAAYRVNSVGSLNDKLFKDRESSVKLWTRMIKMLTSYKSIFPDYENIFDEKINEYLFRIDVLNGRILNVLLVLLRHNKYDFSIIEKLKLFIKTILNYIRRKIDAYK